MKKSKSNLKWEESNRCISAFSIIIMTAMSFINIGCANLESDQTIEPAAIRTELEANSTAQVNTRVSGNCASIDQEITDRYQAYLSAYMAGDVDNLYSIFWAPDYKEFSVTYDKDREEMREAMTSYYANGGTLSSIVDQLLERNVYKDAAYDIGSFDMVGTVSGTQYTLNRYHFMRWTKGNDGVWRVDKNVAGPRGNTSEVNPNDAGPAVCSNTQASVNEMTNIEITNQFKAYIKTLTEGNADKAYKFWTEDFHFYGNGLDVDRDGLYQYYTNFFQTGRIASSNANLSNRFIHGNVAYDIMLAEDTVVINGVQSVKTSHYVICWQRGHDKVWRISRFMDLASQVAG
jgi:ketosteroid isomerase-like protein